MASNPPVTLHQRPAASEGVASGSSPHGDPPAPPPDKERAVRDARWTLMARRARVAGFVFAVFIVLLWLLVESALQRH